MTDRTITYEPRFCKYRPVCHLFSLECFYVFRQNSHCIVILSGAPHRFIACYSACGAESKDPGGLFLPMPLGAFRPPKPGNRIQLSQELEEAAARVQQEVTAAFVSPPGKDGKFTEPRADS